MAPAWELEVLAGVLAVGEAVEVTDGTKLIPPEELAAGTAAALDEELERPVAPCYVSVPVIRKE